MEKWDDTISESIKFNILNYASHYHMRFAPVEEATAVKVLYHNITRIGLAFIKL